MIIETKNEIETKKLGEKLGCLLCGGEVIELTGDVGSGKTTFVKGVAVGLGIDENVQSPSFTISRTYGGRHNLVLAHYDFYRLEDPGIMSDALKEVSRDPSTVTIIEWAGVVKGVLPSDILKIDILATSETSREISINASGEISREILNGVEA